MTSRSLQTLLHTIVDYAGLFPPAELSMEKAVTAYAGYRHARQSWMLGRFVVPVSRLEEMTRARRALNAPGDEHPWRISALVGEDAKRDIAAAVAFNKSANNAVVDALEVKASTIKAMHGIAEIAPREMRVYVEIPSDSDPREVIAALAAMKLRAKIRTGGTTPGAIPNVEQVGRFLRACYASSVPFKATAGLHHPLRREHALTYAPDAPRGVMHGFLNVFLAAAFHYNGLTQRDTVELLGAETLDDVVMDDEKMAWREYVVTVAEISTLRRRLAISFGSCSFTEPVDDLVKLGLFV